MHWDVGRGVDGLVSDAECWAKALSAASCAQAYLEKIRLKGRGIVAFHSISHDTLALLKELLPALTSAGYRFARLDAIPKLRERISANGGLPGTVAGAPGAMTIRVTRVALGVIFSGFI